MAHVGPPAANVEVKLAVESEEQVNDVSKDPVGKVSTSALGDEHRLTDSSSCSVIHSHVVNYILSLSIVVVISWAKRWGAGPHSPAWFRSG